MSSNSDLARRRSAQAGMEICQQRRHLLFVKPASKTGHQSPAVEDVEPNGCFGCRNAAGQRLVLKYIVQVRRNFLEREVVVLMAMGAANLVKMLPFCLLRR